MSDPRAGPPDDTPASNDTLGRRSDAWAHEVTHAAAEAARTPSFVNRIVAAALRQRLLVVLGAVALVGIGVWSFFRLPVDAYPDLSPPMVEIVTQWPGHAAEEVERLITAPVELQMNGLPGLRVLATATAGVDPRRPGLGIVPAARTALARAGLTVRDLDVVELNEAFAGQVLACCDVLGLDDARVCEEGGALALGHPWGASGAVLAVRLFSRLVHADAGELGLAAIAVGGGQGVAMVVQRCR